MTFRQWLEMMEVLRGIDSKLGALIAMSEKSGSPDEGVATQVSDATEVSGPHFAYDPLTNTVRMQDPRRPGPRT